VVYFADQHELSLQFQFAHCSDFRKRHKSIGRLTTAPGILWDAGGIIRFNASNTHTWSGAALPWHK